MHQGYVLLGQLLVISSIGSLILIALFADKIFAHLHKVAWCLLAFIGATSIWAVVVAVLGSSAFGGVL